MEPFTTLQASVSASAEETACYAITRPEHIPEADPQEQVSIPEPLIRGYELNTEEWRTAQLKDPVTSALHDRIRNGIKPSAKQGLRRIRMWAVTSDWDKLHLRKVCYTRERLLAVRPVSRCCYQQNCKTKCSRLCMSTKVTREETDHHNCSGRGSTDRVWKQGF